MHDSLIRLHPDQLQRLALVHVHSGVDVSDNGDLTSAPLSPNLADWADITGYTEWRSQSRPAVSVGWDWIGALPSGALKVLRASIRTNVMLIDDDGADLGRSVTLTKCEAWLQNWIWQPQVLAAVGYSLPMTLRAP